MRDSDNALPVLTLVLQRPWELTRQELRELKLALDRRGYSETTLATAWRETTNQDMTASIMGYIRQAALGDALVPYEQRVEQALQRILASRAWSAPQRQWLQRIANQTKAITIVDREALDDDALLFRREGGGWQRLNQLFGGELDQVLDPFQREWASSWNWVSRFQCQPSMLHRSRTSCSSASGVVRRLVSHREVRCLKQNRWVA